MEQRIEPTVGVVIVAGGSGSRMGGAKPKQFQFLGNQPLLVHTIRSFAEALPSAAIVVVLASDMVEYWSNLSSRFETPKHRVVCGGEFRYDSVKAGVEALSDTVDIIAVHDGARPLCSRDLIHRCVDCAVSNGSAIPVVEVRDSLRVVDGDTSKSLLRSTVRAVQTPQVFDAVILRRAYLQPYADTFTDDASLVESSGERMYLCDGEYQNIKITTREDMLLAHQILEQQSDDEETL